MTDQGAQMPAGTVNFLATGSPPARRFARWHPQVAVVFDGCASGDGPAEQVCSGYLNFFASEASATEWARQHPGVTGSVLDQASAEREGTQTFGSLLADPS